MSMFAGLDIARKGLTASQKAIEVTGHNIANANTAGYTRQRLATASIEPAAGQSRLAQSAADQIGQGVRIINVEQIRNSFLDRQYRQESSLDAEWNTRAESLAYIESVFDEMSETGLSAAIGQFAGSLQELSKDPSTRENRANVLQNAISLTETLQHFASQLAEKQLEQDQAVVTVTGQINSLALSIADLNSQVALYELNGQNANDLRDQRNLKLDELSRLVGITTAENSQGQLQVSIGGEMLVSHHTVRLLDNVRTVANPINGSPDNLHSVIWADTGAEVTIASGSLRATLDLRDGETVNDVGLPYLNGQLDRLAVALADSFNAVHAAGWTLPAVSGNPPSQTGIEFFASATDASGDPLPMSAATIRVNPAIENDLQLIAGSSQAVTTAGLAGNNINALRLAELFSSHNISDIGSFNGFINGFVSTIAVEAGMANNRAANQSALVASIDEHRQSVSGVSLDEETASLIRYQHSYSAAARVITAIDEMLDVLINRTGMVGR